ncbi:hypothetical protein EJ110_NYTH44597 [Nymphaea thermarum]|nr:hypothetical protein EJ110_NYTH44597 [Nymphaea thermarum]
MAAGAYFSSLSEAASAISSYFGGNHGTAAEGGSSNMAHRSDGVARYAKAEAAKRPKPAVERPRLAPEFDGLNCFETLVSH